MLEMRDVLTRPSYDGADADPGSGAEALAKGTSVASAIMALDG